jgi:hypothetical protein
MASSRDLKGNRSCLVKVIISLRFFARQGLAIRGDGPGESDGNFSQVMAIFQRSDDMLKDFFGKKEG